MSHIHAGFKTSQSLLDCACIEQLTLGIKNMSAFGDSPRGKGYIGCDHQIAGTCFLDDALVGAVENVLDDCRTGIGIDPYFHAMDFPGAALAGFVFTLYEYFDVGVGLLLDSDQLVDQAPGYHGIFR
jgi:hypothetical protein